MKSLYSKNKISIRIDNSIQLLKLDEILFCEREKKTTILHRKDFTTQHLNIPFPEIENKLMKHAFIRTNDDYLINLKYLEKISGENENTITIMGNIIIPINENRKQILINELTNTNQ